MDETVNTGKKGFLHLRNPLRREHRQNTEVNMQNIGSDGTLKEDNISQKTSANQTIEFAPLPDKMYGDADFTVKATSSSGLSVTLTASGACSVSGNNVHIIKAGVCTITAHQEGDDDFNSADDVQQSFNVLPAPLTVTADNKSMKYGGPLPQFRATVSGLVNGFEPLGIFNFTTTATPGSPPGTYTITPAGLDSPNYSYTYIDGTLTITPVALEITADDKTIEYGEPLPAFTARISGLENDDTIESLGELVFDTEATQGSPAGSYNITPRGLVSPNYTYQYNGGTLSITPATLKISVNDKSVIYGELLPEFNSRVTGLVNGDTMDILGELTYICTATPGSPAGTYTIAVDKLGLQNYACEYLDGTLFITPALLTIKAEDKSMEYGSGVPDFSVVVSGLVNGDTLESLGKITYNCAAMSGSPVGSYVITTEGLESGNYTLDYEDGMLNVTPAPLTITAEDLIVLYGTAEFDFRVTVKGLVEGDTLESLGELIFDTEAEPGSPAGIYDVIPGGLTSPNYTYNWVKGSVIITPAPLLVRADDKSIVCGEPLPAFTVSVSGLVNGDKLETLGKLVFSTTATKDSPEGTYTIVPAGLDSPDYTYNYVNGMLTITDAPLPVATDSGKKKKKDDSSDVVIDTPRLGEVLVDNGLISPKELVTALSKQLGVPEIDLNTCKIETESLRLVPESLARKYGVIPLSMSKGYLLVAMADPTDILAIEALSAQTKMRIRPMIALAEEIQKALDRNYKSFIELEKQFVDVKSSTEVKTKLLDESIAEAPAVRSLDIILEEAVKNRASDIHIEPEATSVRIRYRIDGVMHEVAFLPLSAHGPLISRLKVLANMNIADHRPQDGQFNFKAWEKDVDVRVAVIATAYGEMGTLRLLDKSFAIRNLSEIGFLPENLARYEKMLKSPYGMVLLSGPTGSGKTTTLYASINNLDSTEMKIITIEDPVEYHFSGINQIQVNPRSGITFGSGLRAIMRHDPDVALVGEIRDTDTASIAVQAAMTGHLVLASVHANDSIGVLFRLVDLGIEPFLLASALVGVVAQRMVRRVCPSCRNEAPASLECQEAYFEELNEKRETFSYGKGCPLCANTGYLGRTAVMEILTVSDEIKRLMLAGASTAELRAKAFQEGMVPMRHDGMLKVKAGITTPDEILRNVFSL